MCWVASLSHINDLFAPTLQSEGGGSDRAATDAHALRLDAINDRGLAVLQNQFLDGASAQLDGLLVEQITGGAHHHVSARAGVQMRTADVNHLRTVFSGIDEADNNAFTLDRRAVLAEKFVSINLDARAVKRQHCFGDA